MNILPTTEYMFYKLSLKMNFRMEKYFTSGIQLLHFILVNHNNSVSQAMQTHILLYYKKKKKKCCKHPNHKHVFPTPSRLTAELRTFWPFSRWHGSCF